MGAGRDESFSSLYLNYTAGTEVPVFFSRWASIVGVGAYLGRGTFLTHGHSTLIPNLYCMLIGQPATRKSTAIKLMKSILVKAGYDTIAADKTTKEKFLLDLSGDKGEEAETHPWKRGGGKSKSVGDVEGISLDSINLFGEFCEEVDREILIAADEFNDFFGNGNIEFASLLGSLWDYHGVYRSRIKTGKSVSVYNPTVSLFAGNTATGFSLAFPTDILGQGFFSRLLLVYGEPTSRRIAFPEIPQDEDTAVIVRALQETRKHCTGEIKITKDALYLLNKIYTSHGGINDVRFDTYNNRRFTHLLKLCIICCALHYTRILSESIVIYANTILARTEHLMPKALGSFGKAKHADVVHKVMQVLDGAIGILAVKDLWKHVIHDLEKPADLVEILRNLVAADKVIGVGGGFLIRRTQMNTDTSDMVDFSILTEEEMV